MYPTGVHPVSVRLVGVHVTGRRARWRSQRHVQEILNEMKANKEKWAAADAKWAAEEERRCNSPPAERFQGNGQELLREFDIDRMVFLPAGAALCVFSLWHLHGALVSRTGEGGSCFCRTRQCSTRPSGDWVGGWRCRCLYLYSRASRRRIEMRCWRRRSHFPYC